MSGLVWAAAGALAGVAAALVLFRGGVFSGRRGSGADVSPLPQAWAANGAGDAVRVRLAANDLAVIREDIQKLHVIRSDIRRIGDLLERLLEEAVEPRQTHPSPAEPAASTRDPFREPVRDTSSIPGTPRRDERDLRVRQEPRDAQSVPVLPGPAPIDSVWSAPAAAEPAGPPPGAVHVEAVNDLVVTSERHPPEAWLERRGGEAEVYLNPRVPLTDPALQRWSTFFDWERREPGARYRATRPALVSASGGVVRKGAARPS
jgi:hypothetical protein